MKIFNKLLKGRLTITTKFYFMIFLMKNTPVLCDISDHKFAKCLFSARSLKTFVNNSLTGRNICGAALSCIKMMFAILS